MQQPLGINPGTESVQDARPLVFGEMRTPGDIEQQFHPGFDLVDMLPAGATAARGPEGE
jgi:hypothetical protein